MAAAKIAVLLAATALFATAAAADPQPPQLATEAQCWPCYSSCMHTCDDGHGVTPAPVVNRSQPAAHTAVDNGPTAASVLVNSTDGTAIHKTDGAVVPVNKGGGEDYYEKYFECKKKCIVDCNKDLPPVCYKMCISETCLTLPPCKRGDCYKACGNKCFHSQPYPGPNPAPKPTPPPPTPPKPVTPPPSPPKPMPPPPKAAAEGEAKDAVPVTGY
ncbi:hypothetical protein TRIUR3_04658 [Triticum urartu]|uniref:Uncharacterized protein n=1 Tax=Triticum urartu TaxID=4572 RepID=M7ZVI8_TRIUA|nr:formin-like protein 10 [Triticum urartu]EMS56405.1 hypothetical protein TRIUR3_04658 [Triticum urartu]